MTDPRPARRRQLVLLSGLGLTCALTALARPFNYSIFPEDPAKIQEQIEATKVSLEEAIAQAKAHVGGGVVKSAQLYLPQADAQAPRTPGAKQEQANPEIDVLLYKDGKARRVTIDALSGTIIESVVVPRFFGWEVEGDYVELPSFVRYYDIEKGDGPSPDEDDAVFGVIVGYLADGTVFWDSRLNPDGKTVLYLRNAIAGLKQALTSMREGGKRKIIVPYTQGYGLFGSPPLIPSNATLIFDVAIEKVYKLDAQGNPEGEQAQEEPKKKAIPPPPPAPPGKRLPSPKPYEPEEKPPAPPTGQAA